MTNRERKLKAAAIAVSCYLKFQNDCKENGTCPGWQKMNKLIKLRQRGLVQLKGKLPGNFRLRM